MFEEEGQELVATRFGLNVIRLFYCMCLYRWDKRDVDDKHSSNYEKREWVPIQWSESFNYDQKMGNLI